MRNRARQGDLDITLTARGFGVVGPRFYTWDDDAQEALSWAADLRGDDLGAGRQMGEEAIEPLAQAAVLDEHQSLHPKVAVAWHPVGDAEAKHLRMLQETPQHRANPAVAREPWESRPRVADTPDEGNVPRARPRSRRCQSIAKARSPSRPGS
jgi:hypothetical protein